MQLDRLQKKWPLMARDTQRRLRALVDWSDIHLVPWLAPAAAVGHQNKSEGVLAPRTAVDSAPKHSRLVHVREARRESVRFGKVI